MLKSQIDLNIKSYKMSKILSVWIKNICLMSLYRTVRSWSSDISFDIQANSQILYKVLYLAVT